ncbi:unnamed protein product [Anisakis simplex]|uniref:SPX domain-containing protein n=1 Tax=Anisakis simplex TaxID=6269 RepID=A0A0M3KIK4_ANISI|nr:unnamed protein product [Anisakis simplex]
MEALRRFRDQQQGEPSGASLDDYNALMKRYEEAIERIVELESRGEGGSSKLAALEAELKRTRERLAESQVSEILVVVQRMLHSTVSAYNWLDFVNLCDR